MVHISDESIAEVRRVSEWHAEQQEREESEAASNARAQEARERAMETLDILDDFTRFYMAVRAVYAAGGGMRDLQWALSGVSGSVLLEKHNRLVARLAGE